MNKHTNYCVVTYSKRSKMCSLAPTLNYSNKFGLMKGYLEKFLLNFQCVGIGGQK